MTRRQFLKTTGLGAAAIGVLAGTPASALNIRDSEGLKVFSDGTERMSSAAGQPFKINASNLHVLDGDIEVGHNSGGDIRITGSLTEGASL
ncbi:MAG: twin-arginine translocation signal domain-containing protein [Candidatus Nanohaloarchaea archaeon]